MSETSGPITGGCLCRALRYEARSQPTFAGFCFCGDCRKASGGGSIGFLNVDASGLTITGPARQFTSRSFRGGEATRNFCPTCGSLVFGGIVGQSDSHTLYAGSLDDPSVFRPTMAIFNRDRPAWAPLAPDLVVFETMPTGA
jgi:hypothetical protein